MENYKLGRAVLTKAERDPDNGGWTMLLSGYKSRHSSFWRANGAPVAGSYADEARALLGMSLEESQEYSDVPNLEVFFDHERGLERFRLMVEASERAAERAAAADHALGNLKRIVENGPVT